MDITSVHKYVALNKLANGSTEVLSAGQPCLTVTENVWKINPVFAKLVYGANVFEDIPPCRDTYDTTEEAVAAGLIQLHDLGAFQTEVDFQTNDGIDQISEDVVAYTSAKCKTVMESHNLYTKIMKSIKDGSFDPSQTYKVKETVSEETKTEETKTDSVVQEVASPVKEVKTTIFDKWISEGNRSEYSANIGLSGALAGAKAGSSTDTKKKIVLRSPSGETISRHDSETDALKTWKNLSNNKGVKIMKEDTDITDQVIFEGTDEDYEKWVADVKAKHPKKDLKFKGRVESGGQSHTTSAEETGKDRSYGVWDHNTNKGHVFEEAQQVVSEKTLTEPEMKKREEIVTALKSDKKFMSKYGKDAAYAVATKKAKEVA